MINTGSIIGACCNIFGEGFPPKYTPSFSWGGASGLRKYQFDKCVEVAEKVMGRRKITFSDKHYRLFEAVQKLADEVENRARVS